MSVSDKSVCVFFFFLFCVHTLLDCVSMGFMKFGIRMVKELFDEDVDKEVKHNPLLKMFPTSKVSSSFRS